jgi:hypothetical protein
MSRHRGYRHRRPLRALVRDSLWVPLLLLVAVILAAAWRFASPVPVRIRQEPPVTRSTTEPAREERAVWAQPDEPSTFATSASEPSDADPPVPANGSPRVAPAPVSAPATAAPAPDEAVKRTPPRRTAAAPRSASAERAEPRRTSVRAPERRSAESAARSPRRSAESAAPAPARRTADSAPSNDSADFSVRWNRADP